MCGGETRSSYGHLKARGFSEGRGSPKGWGLWGRGCCMALLWGWGNRPPVPSWVKGVGPGQGVGDPPRLMLHTGHAGGPVAVLVAPWPCW